MWFGNIPCKHDIRCTIFKNVVPHKHILPRTQEARKILYTIVIYPSRTFIGEWLYAQKQVWKENACVISNWEWRTGQTMQLCAFGIFCLTQCIWTRCCISSIQLDTTVLLVRCSHTCGSGQPGRVLPSRQYRGWCCHLVKLITSRTRSRNRTGVRYKFNLKSHHIRQYTKPTCIISPVLSVYLFENTCCATHLHHNSSKRNQHFQTRGLAEWFHMWESHDGGCPNMPSSRL